MQFIFPVTHVFGADGRTNRRDYFYLPLKHLLTADNEVLSKGLLQLVIHAFAGNFGMEN